MARRICGFCFKTVDEDANENAPEGWEPYWWHADETPGQGNVCLDCLRKGDLVTSSETDHDDGPVLKVGAPKPIEMTGVDVSIVGDGLVTISIKLADGTTRPFAEKVSRVVEQPWTMQALDAID